jgi:hypothetical protein
VREATGEAIRLARLARARVLTAIALTVIGAALVWELWVR